MSDFLISLDTNNNEQLCKGGLDILYTTKPYKYECFTFSWGTLGLLNRNHGCGCHKLENNALIFTWVGDLRIEPKTDWHDILRQINSSGGSDSALYLKNEIARKFDGPFAAVLADDRGLIVITDIMGFTPVYYSSDEHNKISALGTQMDAVAAIAQENTSVDPVSVAEFISFGTNSHPWTIYNTVKEFAPGSLHHIKQKNLKTYQYWQPPEEIKTQYDITSLAGEFKENIQQAVEACCDKKNNAVLLSGGNDSRTILNSIPEHTECLALSFSGVENRETDTAKKVAQSLNRPWQLFIREDNALVNTLKLTTDLAGCEFEWDNAHSLDIIEQIEKLQLDAILSGMLFDAYFKGMYARDFKRCNRFKGLLPAVYQSKTYDYIDDMRGYLFTGLNEQIALAVIERRKLHYQSILPIIQNRTSKSEFLHLYPFSQSKIGACWSAERRVLPIKLVAMNRKLVEFTFKCPLELKLGAKLFNMILPELCGTSAAVPIANDGVKPGSSHLSRLTQRALRKCRQAAANNMQKIGFKTKLVHAWTDYENYWHNNDTMHKLKTECQDIEPRLFATIFRAPLKDILFSPNTDWEAGFRLMQILYYFKQSNKNIKKGL